MKHTISEFIDKNFKYIVVVVSFLFTFYVQSVTNTNNIQELKSSYAALELRIAEQDAQINSLKIDRAIYQATVDQVALIREDIKEVRQDVKELLKKR